MKNKPWILVRWDGLVLRPVADFDLDWLRQYKPNSLLRIQPKQTRKQDPHRLYWAVLRAVVSSTQAPFTAPEDLHHALLLATGKVETVRTLDGQTLVVPSSTAFDAMDEGEFGRYQDEAFRLITTQVCPGVSIKDLLKVAEESCQTKKLALVA